MVIFQVAIVPTDYTAFAAEAVLFILFLFGITVLNRLNQRTVQTRAFRRSLGEVQQYFAAQDSDIVAYLEKQKAHYFVPDAKSRYSRYIQNSFNGGLNDLMILSNGFICSGIGVVALLRVGYGVWVVSAGALIVLFVSTRLLHLYSNHIVKRLRPWMYY